jgi:hypothetical protein
LEAAALAVRVVLWEPLGLTLFLVLYLLQVAVLVVLMRQPLVHQAVLVAVQKLLVVILLGVQLVKV